MARMWLQKPQGESNRPRSRARYRPRLFLPEAPVGAA